MEKGCSREKPEQGVLMIRVALLAIVVLAVTAGIASAADLHDPNNTFSDLLEKDSPGLW